MGCRVNCWEWTLFIRLSLHLLPSLQMGVLPRGEMLLMVDISNMGDAAGGGDSSKVQLRVLLRHTIVVVCWLLLLLLLFLLLLLLMLFLLFAVYGRCCCENTSEATIGFSRAKPQRNLPIEFLELQ